jgi:succinate dehydrogenase/fumarate reductase flavoprotein subunit
MGGIFIDENGWSGIPGLYAGGEAAGGVHGASRVAGNGCSDTLVFGAVAGRGAAQGMLARKAGKCAAATDAALARLMALHGSDTGGALETKDAIRNMLSQVAGIWRSRASLLDGLGALNAISERLDAATGANPADIVSLIEARHMAITARMILGAALSRTESRGAHQRTDFPQCDDANWLRHISFRKGEDGSMVEESIPIQ